MERHALAGEEWKRVEPLLPPQTEGKGRRWENHRRTINGMLWIAKTGAPWRDLPLLYGKWKAVYDRFRRWTQEGLWDRILKELQGDKQKNKEIDWTVFFVDGSNVRAHRHAGGASQKIPENEPKDHDLGRSRGGFGTKVHVVCDGSGMFFETILSPGQDHESTHFEELMETISVPSWRGRPKSRPERICGDKGYSAEHIRA